MAATVWTDELKSDVTALWCNERLSASEIGARFNVSRCAILGLIHRMGLDDSRGETAEQIATRRESRRLIRVARQKIHGERARQAIALAKPKRPKFGIAIPKPKPSDPPPGGFMCVALADRRKDQCTWIVGEPSDGMQCGHQVVAGQSWCGHHHAIVYDRSTPTPFVPLARVLTLAGGVAV